MEGTGLNRRGTGRKGTGSRPGSRRSHVLRSDGASDRVVDIGLQGCRGGGINLAEKQDSEQAYEEALVKAVRKKYVR